MQYVGRAKWKYIFEHAQNAQIQIHPAHAQIIARVSTLYLYIL